MQTICLHQQKLLGCFILSVFLSCTSLYAQVFIEPLPTSRAEGTINIYGRGSLSPRIPYENISGSAFWADEWKPATLIGRTPREKWEMLIKLNLATNEIYYKNPNGEVLVVNDGLVRRIVFHEANDPGKIEAEFLNGIQEPYVSSEKSDDFLQILNEGRYQLLKHNSRKMTEADSLFGTLKRYYFKYETKYFISNKYEIVSSLKKLNKENLLIYGPNTPEKLQWISQNKIDLRKENDVVKFLNHLNESY